MEETSARIDNVSSLCLVIDKHQILIRVARIDQRAVMGDRVLPDTSEHGNWLASHPQ
jgi:hypothetical protein